MRNGPRLKQDTAESSPYRTLTVEKLTPLIGAELAGVDLSRPLSAEQRDEIHRALVENLVIFFRDQEITPGAAPGVRTAVRRAPRPPAAPHETGLPELMIIRTDGSSQRANGEGWHSDVSCEQEPPMGSILYLKQCPPSGGDTLFANTYAAYDALSDRMKAYVEGLTAIHDGEHVYRGLYANAGVADKPTYPRAEHPVVRTHPVTRPEGRCYVNRGFTTRLVGLARDESDAVLATSSITSRTSSSSAASAGARSRSRSGTTAVPSITRCGTTGRIRARATASPSKGIVPTEAVVYGAGGIGGGIGALLAAAGHDVTLIARGEHLARIRARGLEVQTPEWARTSPLAAVGHPREIDWRGDEVVFFTMKSQDTLGALEDLVEVAPAAPVILAQNGVANERMARRRFDRVYAMLVFMPAQFLEAGTIALHATPKRGTLHAGVYPRGVDGLIDGVCRDLRGAGFESDPDPAVMRLKYGKLLTNLGNAVQALCGIEVDLGALTKELRDEGMRCLETAGIGFVTARELVERCRAGARLWARSKVTRGWAARPGRG